jgi:muramidase (phage lysozyme)
MVGLNLLTAIDQIKEEMNNRTSTDDKTIAKQGLMGSTSEGNDKPNPFSVILDTLSNLKEKREITQKELSRYQSPRPMSFAGAAVPEITDEDLRKFERDARIKPMNFSGSVVRERDFVESDIMKDVRADAAEKLVEEKPAVDITKAIEQDQIEQQDISTLKGNKVGLMAKPVSVINTSGTSFLNFIAKGEGDYGSSNRGTKNNKIQGSTNTTDRGGVKLTELTIDDIRKYQKIKDPDNPNRLFAVGKYQLIPTTFDMVVKGLGLPKNTIFNEETQEKMGRYLLFQKRPALGAYIKGESNDETTALLEASKEWASLPSPKTGNSYYGKGNKAQHTLKETKIALNKARNEYAKNKQD